jgi:hypothetical protein
MRKLWILNLSFVVLFSVFFFGCSAMKKTKTVTVTETLIKIDTVIKIKTDTILKVQYVTLHDTAIIENKTSIAKSYFSTSKQRIVLELKGKSFDVPITVFKKVIEVEKKNESIPIKEKLSFGSKFLVGIFSIMLITIIIFFIQHRKEIIK